MSSQIYPAEASAEAGVARRSARLNGRDVSYLVAGEAEAGNEQDLLLIHGAGVSARSWINQLRGLGQVLRVFAIDLPGHGQSDPVPEATVEGHAEVAARFLDQLGIGPVFVAGHSLGGAVAQALAARHPGLVKGLVLLSTCAKFPETDSPPGRFLWYLPGPIRKVLFFSMAKKILFAHWAPRKAILLGMEEIRTCRPETILKDVAAARAMDLEVVARGLRVPTLILCGSRDRLTPPTSSERLNELIPESRLQIVEGAGHMLPLEVPDHINQELLDFVDSRPGIKGRLLSVTARVLRRSIFRGLLDRVKGWFVRTTRGRLRQRDSGGFPPVR